MYEYMKLSKISLSALLLTFSLYGVSAPSSAMTNDEDEEYIMSRRFVSSLSINDCSTSTEKSRRYERLFHLLPKTHIPQHFQFNKDFDHIFSGVRVSRVGSVIRIGNREYNVSSSLEFFTNVNKQTKSIFNLPEVVNTCINDEEAISYYLPVASFIDSKVNFLNGKRSGVAFPPIDETVAGVHIHSSPGQITIGSHVYALSEGRIILEYKNRNPSGVLIDQPAVPFIETIITEVRSQKRENEQKTRAIEWHQERKAASFERQERQKVAKKEKQQEKQKKQREILEKEAENLGILSFNVSCYSTDELKDRIKKKQEEKNKEEKEKEMAEARKAWHSEEIRRQNENHFKRTNTSYRASRNNTPVVKKVEKHEDYTDSSGLHIYTGPIFDNKGHVVGHGYVTPSGSPVGSFCPSGWPDS